MHHQESILETIARSAQCDPASLSVADTLDEIGIDSLKFIVMMLDVERLLQRKIFNIDIVGKLRTVGDILALAGE